MGLAFTMSSIWIPRAEKLGLSQLKKKPKVKQNLWRVVFPHSSDSPSAPTSVQPGPPGQSCWVFSHLDLMFANIIGNIMLYVQMSVWLMCMFLWFKSATDFWNFIVLWLNVGLLTLLLYGFLISLVQCGPTLFLEINKHVNKMNGFMPLTRKCFI